MSLCFCFLNHFGWLLNIINIVSLGKRNMSNYLHMCPKALTKKLKIAKYYCISIFLVKFICNLKSMIYKAIWITPRKHICNQMKSYRRTISARNWKIGNIGHNYKVVAISQIDNCGIQKQYFKYGLSKFCHNQMNCLFNVAVYSFPHFKYLYQ